MVFLNGKTTREETQIIDLDDSEIGNININQEINNFNNIFAKMGELLKVINKQLQKEFYSEFQEILKLEIEKINRSVDNVEPNYLYTARVLSVFHNY